MYMYGCAALFCVVGFSFWLCASLTASWLDCLCVCCWLVPCLIASFLAFLCLDVCFRVWFLFASWCLCVRVSFCHCFLVSLYPYILVSMCVVFLLFCACFCVCARLRALPLDSRCLFGVRVVVCLVRDAELRPLAQRRGSRRRPMAWRFAMPRHRETWGVSKSNMQMTFTTMGVDQKVFFTWDDHWEIHKKVDTLQ